MFSVTADGETSPSIYSGDSVDDIAVWTDRLSPADSLIIATLKASNQRPVKPTGLLVYNLQGKQLQFIPGGTPNNIDLRPDVSLEKLGNIPLIAVSNWWSGDVYFYTITEGRVHRMMESVPTEMARLRGICLYQTPTQLSYFVVSGDGEGAQYAIAEDGSVTQVSAFSLPGGSEGCVVDDQLHRLYVAVERQGIFRFDTQHIHRGFGTVADTSLFGALRADVEGLTLYEEGSDGFLIASSQGNSCFVIYDRQDNSLVSSFTIRRGTTDEVTKTDGIRAVSHSLGPSFPDGVFIAHDHENQDNGEPANQNFKLVDWRRIAERLKPRQLP